MKNKSHDHTYSISLGLALFAMFFGAGNLFYPVLVGFESGDYTLIGIIGFMITAIALPFLGLIAMILFDGNYYIFFNRLGNSLGNAIIFLCMLIIGPALAIPRIIMLTHIMIAPSLPASFQSISPTTSCIFAIAFLAVVFFVTYRENRIIKILGHVVSPLLIASISTIIVKGFATAQSQTFHTYSPLKTFFINCARGYETLDLLAAIFLSSIAFRILRNTTGGYVGFKKHHMTIITRGGMLCAALLAAMYIGLAYVGSYHGVACVANSTLFRMVSLNALGNYGSLFAIIAVVTACLSTAMTLSAVVAQYVQTTILKNSIRYESALLIVLALCIPLSTQGLDSILALTKGPLTYVGYPVLITLTVCNITYKIWNFTPVIIPTIMTCFGGLILYYAWGIA